MKGGTWVGILVCAIVALGIPSIAQADIITYTDEATFLLAAGPLDLESFEGLTATNSFTASQFVLPGFTVSESSASNELGIWDVGFVGGFATHGSNWLGYQSAENEILRFELNNPVSAFGLNITDFGDFDRGSLTFTNSNGDVEVIAIAPRANGNQLFFGAVSTTGSFTDVVLTNTIPGEFYGVDEVYFGLAIPEPTSLALVGLGAIGLVVLRRRRRGTTA